MPGIPGAHVPTESRWCPVERKKTEWRRYNRQRRRDGTVLHQWRCRSCLDRSDRASKERAELDRSVFSGSTKPSATAAEKRAWNSWVSLTGRPDADRPNSRFLEAYRAVMKNQDGYFKATRGQYEQIVLAASRVQPAARDPLDVRRIVNALSLFSRTGVVPSTDGSVCSFPAAA